MTLLILAYFRWKFFESVNKFLGYYLSKFVIKYKLNFPFNFEIKFVFTFITRFLIKLWFNFNFKLIKNALKFYSIVFVLIARIVVFSNKISFK